MILPELKRICSILIACIAFIACSGEGVFIHSSDLNYQKPDITTVYYFLSPECPLCENYSKDIRELYDQYNKDSVAFYGVFPGDYFSENRIEKYFNEYNIPIVPVLDLDFEMSRYFEATITPECVLVNKVGEVLYQGKLDNWLEELGRRRRSISAYYLKDAIEAHLKGDTIQTKKTKAIGCFIEYKKKL